jgi:hypothetical protein
MSYTNEAYNIFAEEFSDNDEFRPEYSGRNGYSGPALVILESELHKTIRAVDVEIQTDQIGKNGLIVYPTGKFYQPRNGGAYCEDCLRPFDYDKKKGWQIYNGEEETVYLCPEHADPSEGEPPIETED